MSSNEAVPQAPEVVVMGDGDSKADAASRLESIEQPGKVMRIGTMIKQLLEEVREAPLDEKSRVRLAEIYATSVTELSEGLSPDLQQELARLVSPFDGESTPSESELRIAHAQLVGWLEGIFHGIQAAAVFAQQAATRAQLAQIGRGPGMTGQGESDAQGDDRPGTYL